MTAPKEPAPAAAATEAPAEGEGTPAEEAQA